MRKESSVPVPKATIGISSLLVVFIVLCLLSALFMFSMMKKLEAATK